MKKRSSNHFSEAKKQNEREKAEKGSEPESRQRMQNPKPKNPLALMMKPLPHNILDLEYAECADFIEQPRLRISHWNVNGIRAALKKQAVRDYIENTQLDILCLNETKINKKKFFKSGIQK